jgi:hypothetical protein
MTTTASIYPHNPAFVHIGVITRCNLLANGVFGGWKTASG